MKILLCLVFLVQAHTLLASGITVQNESELREALSSATDGTILRLAPGNYGAGYYVVGITDLTIEALDPANPPLFEGGKTAWQFSRCSRLTLRHLRISGQTENGINLDDGGEYDKPVPGITLEHIEVSDVGPTGNRDGIKCSGLEALRSVIAPSRAGEVRASIWWDAIGHSSPDVGLLARMASARRRGCR